MLVKVRISAYNSVEKFANNYKTYNPVSINHYTKNLNLQTEILYSVSGYDAEAEIIYKNI